MSPSTDNVLLFAGLLLLVMGCVALGSGWKADRPLRIKSEKIGSYEVPAGIVLLLIGAVLALSNTFMRYETLMHEPEEARKHELTEIKDEIRHLGDVSYTATLDLHDGDTVNDLIDHKACLIAEITPPEGGEAQRLQINNISPDNSTRCEVNLTRVRQASHVKFSVYRPCITSTGLPQLLTRVVTVPDVRLETACPLKDTNCQDAWKHQ